MSDRLLLAIIGNPSSGKSTTWNYVFGAAQKGTTVKTGDYPRKLYLNSAEWIQVFLISGSPEERGVFVGKMLPKEPPRVVLCSIQYREDARTTIEYFSDQGYDLCVYWLNPGYSDEGQTEDGLRLINVLLDKGATVTLRSGKLDPGYRSNDIRQFLYGWAKTRNLTTTDFFMNE